VVIQKRAWSPRSRLLAIAQAVRPSHSSRPFCGMIVRRDLKGKGLAVLERRAAVETETGDAEDGELHR